MVDGMYHDGVCFEGKEDHVWMSNRDFEEYNIGDCVSFFAEVYRYIKTSKGKQIDYSLRNPKNIQKISTYSLPADDELNRQAVNEIICETCYLTDHCNRVNCMFSKSVKRRKRQKQQQYDILTSANNQDKNKGGD